MVTPRKHADLIKAWADGADIEMKIDGRWVQQDFPTWGEFQEFQVRVPKPWYRIARLIAGGACLVQDPVSEDACSAGPNFSRWLTLRIEYDAS